MKGYKAFNSNLTCRGFQFGFHRMTYITEEELKEAIEFYHLKSDCKGGYFRYGRQPITILPRKEQE